VSSSQVKDQNKHEIDRCGYLIKIMAALVNLNKECRVVAKTERLVESLLNVLPTPKHELGEITPSSVIQVPHDVMPPILIGNTARCLMPLADDSDLNAALYIEAKLMGVEKLVCSMATCSDIRVRKNIAILLAKGCRLPGVRDKVDKLRGMQMMVELQDKF
jgi:hypothetical protein